MRRLMGRSLKSCVEIVEGELGRKLPDDFVEKLQAVTLQAFATRPCSRCPACTRRSLRSQAAGLATCVASSGSLRQDGRFARRHRPVGPASTAASSAPARCRAASRFPDLFLHAAIAMNEQPFDSIVVEDSVPGVQAAQAAGMRALAYAGAPHADRDAIGVGGRDPVRRHEQAARAGAEMTAHRLLVDGHRQGRARDRARRRHGGPCRGAAAARFGLHRHRARGARPHRRAHLDRRSRRRAARSRRLVGARRRRQSAGAVVRQARRQADQLGVGSPDHRRARLGEDAHHPAAQGVHGRGGVQYRDRLRELEEQVPDERARGRARSRSRMRSSRCCMQAGCPRSTVS